MKISKYKAANIQLDRAIQMLFDEIDPISTHTLLGASSVIISNLVNFYEPKLSWDRRIQIDSNITKNTYFNLIRKAQNFFKHADKDVNEILDFDIYDTIHVMFITVSNCHLLLKHFQTRLLSHEQSVYELWYLASKPDITSNDKNINDIIKEVFPNFENLSLSEQLKIGKKVLHDLPKLK